MNQTNKYQHNDCLKNHSLLIIGRGKLATHLNKWFKNATVTIHNWHRELGHLDLKEKVKNSQQIILSVSDQAILEVFHLIKNIDEKHENFTHLSGSFYHPDILGVHPIMTFGTELYNEYNQIYLSTDNLKLFTNRFPFLTNPVFEINPELKPLYHALCVCIGNLPVQLANLSHQQILKNNWPVDPFLNLFVQSINNYLNQGIKAMTGPIIRKDEITVKANLNALSTNQSELYEIYKILALSNNNKNKDSI